MVLAKRLALQVLIDARSVEIFADDGLAEQVFQAAHNTGVSVYASGGAVDIGGGQRLAAERPMRLMRHDHAAEEWRHVDRQLSPLR